MTDFNWTNITNWQGLMNVPNSATGGWFWTVMGCYLPFIIAVIVLIPMGWETSIIVGAFIGLLISLLLSYAGVVAWWVVGSFVGIELFMIIYVYWSNRYDY